MMLKKTVTALTLSLGLVAGANAYDNIYDFGTLTAPGTYTGSFIRVGNFLDQLMFNVVGSPVNSGGSVSNVQLFSLYNITGLSVQLYDGTTNALLSNLDLNPESTPNQKVGSGVFNPGKYYFTVGGNGTGTSGGNYSFAANTLPVPEPESYAMLLAGLGLMGTIARRRSKSKSV